MNKTAQPEIKSTLRQWKQYPKYKDSSIPWLGKIPDHWKRLEIKRLSMVKRGASPRPIDDPKYFDDNGMYAWVRIADVTASNRYLEVTTQRLSQLGVSLSVPLEPGRLFLSIAGSVGKPIITKIKCCIHDGFVYFSKQGKYDEFLYYIFKSGQPYLGLGKLGTQLNLNTDTIGDISIGLPSNKEQQTIVKFLDRETGKIAQLIKKKERQIELLKEKRTALISHAVTKGLDPKAKLKDSGIPWLGKIPEGWEERGFKWFFKEIYRYPTYFDIQYVPIGIPEIRGEMLGENGLICPTENDRFISEDTSKKFPKTILEKGDLVMSVRGTMGKIGLIDESFDGGNITANLIRLNPRKEIATGIYLRWLFISNFFEKSLVFASNLTTIFTITIPELAKIKLPLPSLKEQKSIADFLDRERGKIDRMISKVQESIDKLREYRTALISAAVTGKIDVREEVA